MNEPSNVNKLTQAYNRMMERAKARFEELEQAEKEALPKLKHSIEYAAEKAVELGELTREEAYKVSIYLKRDLADAGHYLADTGHDLEKWLRLDLELVEERLIDLFAHAADKTRLEMLDFEETLERASHYYTGEITGPGILQCDKCGESLAFHATGAIPACPQCHSTTFSRMQTEEED